MSAFDIFQANVVCAVLNLHGVPATWEPVAGGLVQSAKVLYKEPSAAFGIGESEIETAEYSVEYHAPSFPGLYESCRRGMFEEISVKGFAFIVRKAVASFDGKTITLTLNRK